MQNNNIFQSSCMITPPSQLQPDVNDAETITLNYKWVKIAFKKVLIKKRTVHVYVYINMY